MKHDTICARVHTPSQVLPSQYESKMLVQSNSLSGASFAENLFPGRMRISVGRLLRSRSVSTGPAKAITQWPYIERPALSKAITAAVCSSPAIGTSWIVGGLGSGKSECINRVLHTVLRSGTHKTYCFSLDFERFDKADIQSEERLALAISRAFAVQLCHQLSSTELIHALTANHPDFSTALKAFAAGHSLWGHYARTCKSVEELWGRIMTSSQVCQKVVPTFRLTADPIAELGLYIRVLRSLNATVAVALLHVEKLEFTTLVNGKGGVVSSIIDPDNRFNVVVECNDSLKSIWNICELPDANLIEVPDLPMEAVSAVFVPALLSDAAHIETVFSICGGRVGHLEKLLVPLNIINQRQKVEDMHQENKYKTGKENRPSAESKELQVDPLIHIREVLLRDSFEDDKIFKPDSDAFEQQMNSILNSFPTLVALRQGMSFIEYNHLVIETVRLIARHLRDRGYLVLPSGMSPMEIAHPVVLALLSSNHLRISWLPYPRIVAESPIKQLLLESWAVAQSETLPLSERIQYNLLLLKNKLHLEQQLSKLS